VNDWRRENHFELLVSYPLTTLARAIRNAYGIENVVFGHNADVEHVLKRLIEYLKLERLSVNRVEYLAHEGRFQLMFSNSDDDARALGLEELARFQKLLEQAGHTENEK
jgi:hypothetical protein